VLEREPPGWYAETHAGSGAYAVVRDRERKYGILRFLEVAPRFAVPARSRYRAIAASYVKGDRCLHPGSALLAMTVLELAARLAGSGTRLVYWYGYDEPGEQAWAHKKLATLTRAPLWCGDALVTGASNAPGDLGRATTPGTGFGVILANVQADTAGACATLGSALCDAYADAVLPDGSPGSLAFASGTSARDGERTKDSGCTEPAAGAARACPAGSIDFRATVNAATALAPGAAQALEG
jgi:hypothetical protein